jgi:hemerythrin-like domain-containing protein
MTATNDPLAVVETRVVHDVHRCATTLLAEASQNPSTPVDALRELRHFVVATLRHHHESEDRDLWVQLTTTAPSMHAALAALSREHDTLDVVLDRLEADASPDAAAAVRHLVHEHLAHEEPVLFPALRTHLTDGDWAAFSQRTVASAPPETAYLLVALFHEVVSDDEVDLVLRHLPPEARALVPTMRAAASTVLDALQGASR